jgi:hypothetical protein
MNIRPVLLLCAALSLTAASVWADGARYPGSPVMAAGSSSLEITTPLNRGFVTEATPGVDLVESADADSAFAPWNSKAFPLLDPSSPSSSDTDTHHAILTPFGYDGVVAVASDGISWNERQQRLAHWREQHDGGSTSVPEPGSLPLVLIGLAALGFVALRRGGLPIAR